MVARERDLRVEVLANTMESLEVPLDELLCFRERDLELTREGVRSLSVDRREVDRLRACSHLLRHFTDRHIEDERRGLAMDVAAGLEGLNECGISRQVRQQA